MPEAETTFVISQDARLSGFFKTVSTRDQWSAEDTFVPNREILNIMSRLQSVDGSSISEIIKIPSIIGPVD